jgi:hypothetical protein
MDLGEEVWGDVDWIGLAKDRNRWRAVVNFGIEPSGSMKLSSGLSSSVQLHIVTQSVISGPRSKQDSSSGVPHCCPRRSIVGLHIHILYAALCCGS